MPAARFRLLVSAVCAASLGLGAPAGAFVVDPGPNPSADPRRDVERAARWDVQSGSLLETGQRGLGGGLEYSVDPSVCEELTFIDEASCADIRGVIAEAGARWAAGHAHIHFVDVTDQIPAAVPPPDEAWRGYGAEIDFFAAPNDAFTPFHRHDVGADTRTFYVFSPKPRDANGAPVVAARGRYTSADVRFNMAECFYLRVENARADCMHFGSVVLHELAHVFGLDHPDTNPERNLDLDDDPDNAMRFDCAKPTAGLAPARPVSDRAVTRSRLSGPEPWINGLSGDDLAGRDALYPNCSGADAAERTVAWGAFALDPSGVYGWSRDHHTAAGARFAALDACEDQRGRDCAVTAAFQECFALARDPQGPYGWAVRVDTPAAEAGALANCRLRGSTCSVRLSYCAAVADRARLAARPATQ